MKISVYFKRIGMVYVTERAKYIEALNLCREKESTQPIIEFMAQQYLKFLEEQLKKSEGNNKGMSFMF